MANFDILTTLEYYSNKSNVLDGNNKRLPTSAFQNFYQPAQNLTADSEVNQSFNFTYLAFDADGFSSTEASSISNLSINLAATANIIDLTDTAVNGDSLVIVSLYIQNIGQESISKKYYKTEDNTILTGTKKVKEIKSCEYVVLPQLLPRIRHYINE